MILLPWHLLQVLVTLLHQHQQKAMAQVRLRLWEQEMCQLGQRRWRLGLGWWC